MSQSKSSGGLKLWGGEIRKSFRRPPAHGAGIRDMESVNKIKEALSQRSRTATLDQLRSEGRKRVRLIRAEHVAQMISQAVHAAIKQSGLIKPEEVDSLVETSRTEFKKILGEREEELQGSREVAERLEHAELELTEIKARFTTLSEEVAAKRSKLEHATSGLEQTTGELKQANNKIAQINREREQANRRLEQVINELKQANNKLAQINREREQASSGFEQASSNLNHVKSELRHANSKLDDAGGELQQVNKKLEQANAALRQSSDKIQQSDNEVAEANSRLEQANSELEELRRLRDSFESKPEAPPQEAISSDMMMSIMKELATLKASVVNQQQQPAAPAGAADLTAALEKISGGLNDKLEMIGKKMGVSGAVEGDVTPDFSGMMNDGDEVQLESNMDNIKIKQKSAGGIAANLARLKKLKDGGA